MSLFARHDLRDRVKHAELFAMSRVRRLMHHKTRKHLCAFSAGVGLMLLGSSLAIYKDSMPLPHVLMDGMAYFIHGVGAIPFVRHIEPLWVVLFGE